MNSKNKKNNLIFIIMTIFFLIIAFFLIIVSSMSDNEMIESGRDFSIKKYDVVLNVHDNGIVDVSETINVSYNKAGGRFIKRIPMKSVYTNRDNNSYYQRMKVTNLEVVGDKYSIVDDSRNINIYFTENNSNELDKYTINYTYDLGNDVNDNYDEFIFHAFDGFIKSMIRKAQVTINMPKKLDSYELNFYTDKYRTQNANKYVNYKVNDNVISIKYNDSRDTLDSALTIDLTLKDNYFSLKEESFQWFSLIFLLIGLLLLTFNIYKCLKKKRIVNQKFSEEYLDAILMGYLDNNKIINKKILSTLIFQLAHKGYIRIDEFKVEGKWKVKITNLIINPIKPIEP